MVKKRNLIHPDVLIDRLASPELIIDKKVFVSFCSNNYLGLSMRPEVIKASKNALIKYTNGTSESRKLGGNLKVLEDLVEQYRHLFGQASVEVCKEAVSKILIGVAKENIPSSLQ